MEQRGKVKGFGPLVPAAPKGLMLGTYPSPKSFEQGFFYGHPQNRFWPLLARLAGEETPATVEARQAFILAHRLALWDVLETCTIIGASDASIRDPVPNDLASLVKKHNISRIFCNGATAHRLYQRHCQAATGMEAVKLPSTSPANAAFSLDRLAEAWREVAAYL